MVCLCSCVTDAPRKRVDSKCVPSPQLQLQRNRLVCLGESKAARITTFHIYSRAQSIGSANLDPLPPRSPRLSVTAKPNYSPSTQGYYTYNTSTPPATRVRKTSHAPITDSVVAQAPGSSNTLDPAAIPPPAPTQWKRKLSQTMKHLVVSPRFHRKRYDGNSPESPGTDIPTAASPQL